MSVALFHARRPLGVLLLSAASAAGANPTGPATLPSEEDLAPTVAPPSLAPWSWRATGLRRGFPPPAAPDRPSARLRQPEPPGRRRRDAVAVLLEVDELGLDRLDRELIGNVSIKLVDIGREFGARLADRPAF